MRSLPLWPSNSSVYSGKPEVARDVSSTNAGGREFLALAFAVTSIRRFSLPPSRCSAAAVRLMPSRRATAAAAAHNSSGMRAFPCRVCLHCSKRDCTSSMFGVCVLLLCAMANPFCRPVGERMTLSVMRSRIHASLPKPHLLHELVSAAIVIVAVRGLQNRSIPFLGSVLHPVLKLIGDFRQGPLGHPFSFPVGVEKPEHALGLLEGLDQAVKQNAIKASIAELNAILVVFEKGVHGHLQCGELPRAYSREPLPVYASAETCRSKLSRSAGVAQSA